MAELFRAFLLTSAVGTALAIILTLLKPITRKHFSGGWHYYIWLVVLLVMIFPIKLNLLEKPITTQNTKTINTTLKEETQTPLTETPITVQEETQPITIQPTQPEKISFMQQIKNFISNNAVLISCIWLSGALLLLLLRLLNYMIFLIRVHRYTEIISCPEVTQYTKRKIKTRRSEKISSPLIIGVFKPTLLLPRTVLTPEQLHNILSHETTHLNRNDLVYKWFVGFVKCLCWYNPMIYFISRQINIDCEISCDLAVVEKMNEDEKKSYIETILSLLSHNKSRVVPLTTGMASNKKILKRRFTMIKKKKNISKRNKILSSILAIVLLITTLLTSGVLATALDNDYDIKIMLNGNEISLNNKPFFYEQSVYVPLRELTEKMGISENKIIWDNGKITIYLDGYRSFYELYIGENKIYYDAVEPDINANGYILEKDSPMLLNDKTYVPFNYIRDIFNAFEIYDNVSYIFGDIDSRIAYKDNAEFFRYDDIVLLQYKTDNGYYPFRLNGKEVIDYFFARDGALPEDKIVEFIEEKTSCKGTYIEKGILYQFELFKPLQNDEFGVWIVRSVEKKITVDYNNSNIYSIEDMDLAIRVIEEEFNTWEGCELHSISYIGDKECNEMLKNTPSHRELGKGNYDEYIIFTSSFQSPKEVEGTAWRSDVEYTDWNWWLGRNTSGNWELLTWGY